MSPSEYESKAYTGNFIRAEMMNLVRRAEEILVEPTQSLCEFAARHSGLSADRTDEQVFECIARAETFCRRCEIELCPQHAQVFGCETYCPDCKRVVRAIMLPIIHEA